MTDAVRPWPALPDEGARLEALRGLDLLDTPPEERFDRITRLAQRTLGAPIALVTLVDAERQWFKSCQGLSVTETPRSVSFCTYAIASDDLFEVPDAREDGRFRDNPAVTGEPFVRFYAGKPLRAPSGHRLGTLCIVDRHPRTLDDAERRDLEDLAAWAELELAASQVRDAVRELERLRSQHTSVLRSAAEGILAVDASGIVTLANPTAERLTGWDGPGLVGRPFHEVLQAQREDGTHLPFEASPVGRALGAHEAVADADVVLWRRDGHRLDVQLSVAPLSDADDVVGAVVVFQDVTERREVERLKDEFVSTVSHELRTPLTSIRGSLRLLQAGVAGPLPAEATELISIAASNTDRLARLVNDILDLRRLTSGRAQLVREDVSASEVVEAAARAVAGPAREAGIEVVADLDPDLLMCADPDRVVQVLTNLLGNAVKFSPPGAAVEVTARRAGDHVALAVLDRGRGIPPEKLDTVFERFEQVETGDARVHGGSGLGLAICRAIVDAHGGRIWAEPRPEGGSAFVLTLPLAGDRDDGAPA